jgi:hypothetical protein
MFKYEVGYLRDRLPISCAETISEVSEYWEGNWNKSPTSDVNN